MYDFLPEKYHNDCKLAIRLVKINKKNYFFLPEKLKNKISVMKTIILEEDIENYSADDEIISFMKNPNKANKIFEELIKMKLIEKLIFFVNLFIKNYSNSFEVIKTILPYEKYSLEHLSNELKKNKNLALFAISLYDDALKFFSIDIKKDQEVVYEAVRNFGISLFYAHMSFTCDKILVKLALEKEPKIFKFLSENKRNDKNIILKQASRNGLILKYVSLSMRDDIDIVKTAIKNNPLSYKFISSRFINDRNIAMECIIRNGDVYQYLPTKFKFDIEFVYKAIETSYIIIKTIPKQFIIKDNNILIKVLDIIHKDYIFDLWGLCIKYFKKKSINKELIMKFLKINYKVYRCINNNFFYDKEISKLFISLNNENFNYIPIELKNDKNFILELIDKGNKLIIKYLNIRFYHDIDIALNFVYKFPKTLKYFCNKFRRNKYELNNDNFFNHFENIISREEIEKSLTTRNFE